MFRIDKAIYDADSAICKNIDRFDSSERGLLSQNILSQLSTLVPFQVAYAVSIHKAQGLEYNSVKIIITNEIEELITHNIFYTAITRAKEKLKIYWTPESEQHVLESLEKRNYNRDAFLLKSLFSL